ncbi:hypothetical protein PR003_g23509 [Phytophthora rubi]|uniref:Uncharacterized protein n=1 Tax=Phytophthora rubi TaxID=129364 RepID=A0A6A3IMA9_9STRA|nr:hypothetical protein PR002_g23057 [Phytophthora rubi]KAE9297398.1 hypothetical protein PR003_g23509 [Phytophthora rubi]
MNNLEAEKNQVAGVEEETPPSGVENKGHSAGTETRSVADRVEAVTVTEESEVSAYTPLGNDSTPRTVTLVNSEEEKNGITSRDRADAARSDPAGSEKNAPTENGEEPRSEGGIVGPSPTRSILKREGSSSRWKTKEPSLKYQEEGVELGDTAFIRWGDDLEGTGEPRIAPVAATAEPTASTSTTAKSDSNPHTKDCTASEEKGQRESGQGRSEKETSVPARYDRLFTDEELNAMESDQGGTVPTNSEVTPEPEEYDKELEDRLYPLDEVELKKRVKDNAEAVKEPSLTDMAELLNIPLATLERTREASPSGSSTPE